jgi:hypothetical protein
MPAQDICKRLAQTTSRGAPRPWNRGTAPSALPEVLPGSRAQEGEALVINLFGGAGVGKSTMASKIFAGLKERGIEAACPEEHAKLAIWSRQSWLLKHQPVILGRTWETILSLQDHVDAIVVDSPLLLCSTYAGDREPMAFHDLCMDMHRRSNRMNIVISRDHEADYDQRSRMQNVDEAVAFDEIIRARLLDEGEAFTDLCRTAPSVAAIVERVALWLSADDLRVAPAA